MGILKSDGDIIYTRDLFGPVVEAIKLEEMTPYISTNISVPYTYDNMSLFDVSNNSCCTPYYKK